MVKTTPQGKKRPFSRGLLLTIVTFGIYGVYWAYKAPKELYDQFELRREGRDDGVVWLVLGLLIPFLIFVYFWKAVENVAYLRKRLGLPESLSPLAFIGLNLGASAITLAAALVALTGGELSASSGADPATVLGGLIAVILVGVLVGLVVQGYAYYRFQTDINDVWDAWQARLDELTGPGPETGQGSSGGWPSGQDEAPA